MTDKMVELGKYEYDGKWYFVRAKNSRLRELEENGYEEKSFISAGIANWIAGNTESRYYSGFQIERCTPPRVVLCEIKKPQRDFEALTRAALRKPKSEDDALREKYGDKKSEASARSSEAPEAGVPVATPAQNSTEDRFEPVGTMPEIGDTVIPIGFNKPSSYIIRAYDEHSRMYRYKGWDDKFGCKEFRFKNGEFRVLKCGVKRERAGRLPLNNLIVQVRGGINA